MNHLGIATNPKRALDDEIQWASEHGFNFVDVRAEAPSAAVESTPWADIGATARNAGVGLVLHAASYLPLANPSPLVRQAALDELRRTIDAAKLAQAPLVTLTFAGWPAYFSEKLGYEYTTQMMSILVAHGQERDVEVALENSPRNQHQLKYFREIFHRVAGLKLTYDIGNGNVGTAAQHTSRDYLFALSGHLAHVHLSDNDGSAATHLPPGTPHSGGIDLNRDLQTLDSFGYKGRITLEIGGDRTWRLATATHVRELWAEMDSGD